MSLGLAHAGHSLEHRLDVVQRHGYKGIELSYDDLFGLAKQRYAATDGFSLEPSVEDQLVAAQEIHDMCGLRGLEIISLQPFRHYEGLVDRHEHNRRVEELRLWICLAHELGTDLILIPSSFLPAAQVTADVELIAASLREAADIGLQQSPPIRFAYEGLSWGTRVNTWEQSWEVVQMVNHPNLGICLDTFNMAGRIFADPTLPTGKLPGAEGEVRRSMARLAADVDVRKIFYIQVVDGAKLRNPLVKGHLFYDPNQPARMSWSRNCRLFYGEGDRGAYLPIYEIVSVIFHQLGYDGWVSLELFNRRMEDPDEQVPEELARRGVISWNKLARDMNVKRMMPLLEESSGALE